MMPIDISQSSVANWTSRLRLLLCAVLIPAAVAGSNQWLYDAIGTSRWLQAWLYPWMTVTAAVLSWCAGRYLPTAALRWIVFAWCLLLLDLLTLAACQDGRIPDHFGFVLVSSQVSLWCCGPCWDRSPGNGVCRRCWLPRRLSLEYPEFSRTIGRPGRGM
jgi:hypothetical protein